MTSLQVVSPPMRIESDSIAMPLISEMPETSTPELGSGRSPKRGKEIRATRQDLTAVLGQYLNRFVECPGPEVQAVVPQPQPKTPRSTRDLASFLYERFALYRGRRTRKPMNHEGHEVSRRTSFQFIFV